MLKRYETWLYVFLSLLCGTRSLASEQRLKIEGAWREGRLIVHRVQQRNPDKDGKRIRVTGQILEMDVKNRLLKIGPAVLMWKADQHESLAQFEAGSTVVVNARSFGNQPFQIIRIGPEALETPDHVEIIGAVFHTERQGSLNRIDVAGILLSIPTRLYSNGQVRLRRLDERRPDSQLNIRFGPARVTIGGELEWKSKIEDDRDLDRGENDDLAETQVGAQLEGFIELTESLSAFLELKADFTQEFEFPLERLSDETDISRGETWLYMEQPLDWPIALQVGRQNFAEEREWWWDEDLDAVRVFYHTQGFTFEVAVAEELGREHLTDDHADPEDKDILRILANAKWNLSSALTVDAFYLRQDDHSSVFRKGQTLQKRREDKDDSDLYWLGTRVSGEIDPTPSAEVAYWADWAIVHGDETVFDFDDVGNGLSTVDEIQPFRRRGWAIDVGASVTWDTAHEPTLTLAYASGSGDDDADGTFRSTGLNDNTGKFNGVDRFRYYGEFTRPELSNLGVTTLALGFRFWKNSSVEFIHHNYRQRESNTDHPLRVDAQSNGVSSDLGDEFNIVAGIEEWKHWEIEVVGSYFLPGSAFEENDSAKLMALKINYNF